MLTKRITACLDVKDSRIIKGVQFKNHKDMGDIVEFAKFYSQNSIDELASYNIAASAKGERINRRRVSEVAKCTSIPFCVVRGIKSEADATELLAYGADKISISPLALNDPTLITRLTKNFGTQHVVVGVGSFKDENGDLKVFQFTGDEDKSKHSGKDTLEWIKEAINLGAGEIVLSMIDQDGIKKGYDLEQLCAVRKLCCMPLIASRGARGMRRFLEVSEPSANGALAASVSHQRLIDIKGLKLFLKENGVNVRL